jgi:hypothetical protein
MPRSAAAPNAAQPAAPGKEEKKEPEEPPIPIGHLVQPMLMKLIWLFAAMAAIGAGLNAHDNGSDLIGIAWRSAGSAAVVASFGMLMLKPLFFSLKYTVAETQEKLRTPPRTQA